MLLMVGCSWLPKKNEHVVVQIVKVSPPAFLYSECGSGKISEVNENSTVADIIVQSLERKKELDKCIEISKNLKLWSESP